jgi:chaperonin GroEL
VVEKLNRNRKTLATTTTKLKQVARISANGDETIGKLIAEAMEKVTKKALSQLKNRRARHLCRP